MIRHLRKDMQLLVAGGADLLLVGLLSVTLLLVGYMALSPRPDEREAALTGMYVITAILMSVQLIQTLFKAEEDTAALRRVLIMGEATESLVAKIMAFLIVFGAERALSAVVGAAFFEVSAKVNLPRLWGIGVAMGLGFGFVGSLCHTIGRSSQRGRLLGMALYVPLVLPLGLAAAAAMAASPIDPSEENAMLKWLSLLALLDFVYAAIAVSVYDQVLIEE